jgi:hypothetical protein
MVLSAATHCDARTDQPARRRRTLRGTRTPMSNAANQRALGTTAGNVRRWGGAPLHWFVRHRVLQIAAVPPAALPLVVTKLTGCVLARQLTTMKRRLGERGGVRSLAGTRTRCLTLPISGRVNGNSRSLRTARHTLRCIGLLDSASASTPPRPSAAPASLVANHSRNSGARQLTTKKRRPSQRGGAGHSEVLVRDV